MTILQEVNHLFSIREDELNNKIKELLESKEQLIQKIHDLESLLSQLKE